MKSEMSGKRKNFHGRESFHRINFLYQASHLPLPPSLSAYYGNIATGVAKKSVLRIDPGMKRSLCKGCCSLLVPGRRATARVKRKQLQVTCTTCHTCKRFNLRPDYSIWSEKEESVAEVIVCGDNQVSEDDATDKQQDSVGQSEESMAQFQVCVDTQASKNNEFGSKKESETCVQGQSTENDGIETAS